MENLKEMTDQEIQELIQKATEELESRKPKNLIDKLFLNPLSTKGSIYYDEWIGAHNGVLLHHMRNDTRRLVTRDEATRIIESGNELHSPINWELLDGYNENLQEFWELTGKFPEEIEQSGFIPTRL